MAFMGGGVELFDRADSGFTGKQVFPEFVFTDADRRNDADAGDYDVIIHGRL